MNKQDASRLFRVLGDESRVKIIKVLYHNTEICACKFLDMVECGQSTLSHHLSVLQKSGLVFQRKDGVKVLYSCNKGLLEELLSFFDTECFCLGGEQ